MKAGTSISLIFPIFVLLTVAHALVLSERTVNTSTHTLNVTAHSKAGLAWPNGNFVDYKQFTATGKVSWYYTWSPSPISSTLEFVPMLWGQRQVSQFSSSINNTIKKLGIKAVLGMNEPQEPHQSNLTAQQGADMWITYLEPLRKRGIRVGTPAPSSNPNGKVWLQDWLKICAGRCHPDFVALHWYDVNATAFKEYVTDFHKTFNLTIWVTEWACQNFNPGPQCTVQQVINFLQETQTFLDETSWVERYSWFGAMENMQGVNEDDALMTKSGVINALGRQYIGSTTSNSTPIAKSAARSIKKFTTGVSSSLNLWTLVLSLTIVSL